MLKRIIHIKNTGVLQNCNSRGDAEFRRLTLLFAENGQGKTTLCSILRSLQIQDVSYISERKTFGASDEPSVHLLFEDKNKISFDGQSWSSQYPDIAIFDSVFIHDNVFAGDYVEHEHKKNLYNVIIGTQGVQLAQEIESIDDEMRKNSADISSKRNAILQKIPKGIDFETFIKIQPDDGIDTKIEQKKKEIADQVLIAKNANEILSKNALSEIVLPKPPEITAILAKQLEDIISDVERRIRNHIQVCQMKDKGEEWLSQGMGYVNDERCPFCSQSIQENDLVVSYRSYFSLTYKSLKNEILLLIEKIETLLGDNALLKIQEELLGNQVLIEFWKKFFEVDMPILSFDDIKEKYTCLKMALLTLVEKKRQSPVELVEVDEETKDALSDIQSKIIEIEHYNTAASKINVLIRDQKASVSCPTDVAILRKDLLTLEAKKQRQDPTTAQECANYLAKQAEKIDLENKKKTSKESLDKYCGQIIQTYEKSINDYLYRFNVGFRIVNSKHQYIGGTPSSSYQIEINGHSVELGNSKTSQGTPCFKSTLSSGDRSALALAFFLASLKQNPNLPNTIIVLDDPFTSQDNFRRTCTQQLIRHFSNEAKQVVVCSHDPFFLKLVYESSIPSEIKVLKMSQSEISEMDIITETQSTYMMNYATLSDYFHDGKGDTMNVARSIRPFLEGRFRFLYPKHFPSNEWLGSFIEKIRKAHQGDELFHLHDKLQEISDINDYSKKFHHEQNANANNEPISDRELCGFVKRTLCLAGVFTE